VHRAGLFVKLARPARRLRAGAHHRDEYFRYDEKGHAMVGSRSGESYRLGDRVTVKLVEAAPVAGALRFALLSEGAGRRRNRPARRTAKTHRPRGKKSSKQRKTR